MTKYRWDLHLHGTIRTALHKSILFRCFGAWQRRNRFPMERTTYEQWYTVCQSKFNCGHEFVQSEFGCYIENLIEIKKAGHDYYQQHLKQSLLKNSKTSGLQSKNYICRFKLKLIGLLIHS